MSTHLPLSAYAEALGELVQHVREEGNVLSSIDQHLIATWWERGYPLDTVLRTVRVTAERLKKRKRPPRGLPLKSMATAVEREGAQAVARHAATNTSVELDDGASALSVAHGDVCAALAARRLGDPSSGPLAQAEAALAAEIAHPSQAGAYVALLRIARLYYDSLVLALPSARRTALRDELRSSMGDAAQRMSPDAFEGTIMELSRRRLQQEDPVLDPRRLTEETDG